MTEQDERIIYEWAIPELKGKAWTLLREEWSDDGRMMPLLQVEGQLGGTYTSSLDMNFAFDVCIPRLVSEGVKVMYNNMGSGEWWMDVSTPESATDIFHEDADFYSALLAYIKGVQ